VSRGMSLMFDNPDSRIAAAQRAVP
jgi:hypothetical protein